MIDCSKEMAKYHDQNVRLGETQKQEMRVRRQANQVRLRSGLELNDEPLPIQFIKQGSYAMYTMVQHPDNDYDIDDGAVFLREDIQGPQGGDKSPREARDMVREALDDGSFNTPPKTLKNCIRVYYEAGYHVDVPVYREFEDDYGQSALEFASSEWRQSYPTKITKWFNDAVVERSPDTLNGRQMRRVVCLLKKFSNSRKTWNLPSGLIISVLINENYIALDGHDDESLYDTIQAIYNRLASVVHQVFNPADSGEELTKGVDDPTIQELEDRLVWALDRLADVKHGTCDKNEALKRWNEIFNTDFFSQFIEEDNDECKARSLNILASSTASIAPKPWTP